MSDGFPLVRKIRARPVQVINLLLPYPFVKSDEIRQNVGGQTGSNDKAQVLKSSHISSSVMVLNSLVVFSQFLLFSLVKVQSYTRPWCNSPDHPSHLALLCTGSPVVYVTVSSKHPLFAAQTLVVHCHLP